MQLVVNKFVKCTLYREFKTRFSLFYNGIHYSLETIILPSKMGTYKYTSIFRNPILLKKMFCIPNSSAKLRFRNWQLKDSNSWNGKSLAYASII